MCWYLSEPFQIMNINEISCAFICNIQNSMLLKIILTNSSIKFVFKVFWINFSPTDALVTRDTLHIGASSRIYLVPNLWICSINDRYWYLRHEWNATVEMNALMMNIKPNLNTCTIEQYLRRVSVREKLLAYQKLGIRADWKISWDQRVWMNLWISRYPDWHLSVFPNWMESWLIMIEILVCYSCLNISIHIE